MICDYCGKKRKNKDIRLTWDGQRVCKDRCWEYRQPQDFVKGVIDWQQLPFSRPDVSPTFVSEDNNLSTTAAVASFTYTPNSGPHPLSVVFTNTSSNIPIITNWDFGDGITSSEINPTHIYTSTGDYIVTLYSANGYGGSYYTQTVTVDAVLPVANFSGTPISGSPPLLVEFTDLSTNSPTSWEWDFDYPNGVNTSTLQNPSYTYTSDGTYSVSLLATNTDGSNRMTKTDYITVSSVPPTAFLFDSFTGTSTWQAHTGELGASSWTWAGGQLSDLTSFQVTGGVLEGPGSAFGDTLGQATGNPPATLGNFYIEVTGMCTSDTTRNKSYGCFSYDDVLTTTNGFRVDVNSYNSNANLRLIISMTSNGVDTYSNLVEITNTLDTFQTLRVEITNSRKTITCYMDGVLIDSGSIANSMPTLFQTGIPLLSTDTTDAKISLISGATF